MLHDGKRLPRRAYVDRITECGEGNNGDRGLRLIILLPGRRYGTVRPRILLKEDAW
jgi:hypothetical protein